MIQFYLFISCVRMIKFDLTKNLRNYCADDIQLHTFPFHLGYLKPDIAKAHGSGYLYGNKMLNYINGKLGSGYSIDVLHGVIVAKFSEGTEVFREDQVLCQIFRPQLNEI